MSKPRHPGYSRFAQEGLGVWGEETGAAVSEEGKGGETQGDKTVAPSPRKAILVVGAPRGNREWGRDGGRGGQRGRGQGQRYPKGGTGRYCPRGEYVTPPEENTDLPDFTPESVHLLLRGFYGDYLHHNDGSHLYGGVADNTILYPCWIRLAM